MNVVVDQLRCQGHTLCAKSAPEVFLLDDDDGHASVADSIAAGGVPAELWDAVRDAARGCPEMAIVISEAS